MFCFSFFFFKFWFQRLITIYFDVGGVESKYCSAIIQKQKIGDQHMSIEIDLHQFTFNVITSRSEKHKTPNFRYSVILWVFFFSKLQELEMCLFFVVGNISFQYN